MDIENVLAQAQKMSSNHVLLAKKPWTWGAEAVFVALTDEYRVPQNYLDSGYEYLLGQEDIVKLLDYLELKKLSSRSKAEFVIHYSVNDAFPSWIDDIGNL